VAKKEKFKTMHNVFDHFTNRVIDKLINEGHFEGLQSPLFVGKESNVFSALTATGGYVVVKIYRLEVCDFNKMYDYIRYDPRFPRMKRNKRDIVFSWAQREYRNLLNARKAGVAVPMVMTVRDNVLVMEQVGIDSPAPKVKDAPPQKPENFMGIVIAQMKLLHKARLVHGDLSQFNILNLDEQPVLIDFSQCSDLGHPRAREFLERDVRNVCRYFAKLGIRKEEEKVFREVIS